jgi:hypothetical protein
MRSDDTLRPEAMLTRICWLALLFALAAAAICGIAVLHRTQRRLQQRVAILRQQSEEAVRRHEDLRRTQNLIARAQAGDAAAARQVHAELLRARAEVTRLAESAEAKHQQKLIQSAAAAEALANNRDPTQGLMRLEYFQEVGQATPSAAFQTLIWAAVKGDDDRVAGLLTVTGAARAQAQAIIAALPEAMRATYPTPEKLAGLALANIVLDQTAIQVLGEIPNDPVTTSLSISGLEAGAQKVSFRQGPNGWQMVMPASAIRALQDNLAVRPSDPGAK